MNILDMSIIFFVLMESANVIILYFFPESKYGNGVAVFNNYDLSKEDENMHLFVRYLTNWVAGVKLIFIVLLIVILLFGDNTLKSYSIMVMILSIASYFWRLAPLIKKLDTNGFITPKGYSKILNYMILGFMIIFSLSLVFYYL
ncbi:MAG: hypothetical protein R3Y13_04805 [bacterium]